MLHSGIDLHKRTVVLSTVDATGERVCEAELPTTRRAVEAYFAAQPGPHRAVVESTATWYWLRDLLVPLGVDLKLGHSKYIKAISYAKDGNKYLKLAFHHAAVRAIQYFPEIQRFYRSTARRKPKAVARALVAKELAKAVYVVLTRQEAFNGTFKGQPLTGPKRRSGHAWRTRPPNWSRRARARREPPPSLIGGPGV